jgi:hypothetical protein
MIIRLITVSPSHPVSVSQSSEIGVVMTHPREQ